MIRDDPDEECGATLEEAVGLREACGLKRMKALIGGARRWGVARQATVNGKSKDRSVLVVAEELVAKVCDAALRLVIVRERLSRGECS